MTALLAEISGQPLLLIAAVMVAIFVLMNSRRRRLDGSPKQYRREIDGATSQSTAVKRDLELLLIELEKLSRRINAQIDTKFAKLEHSIADADKRVTALRILIDEAKKQTESALSAQSVEGPRDQGTKGPGDQDKDTAQSPQHSALSTQHSAPLPQSSTDPTQTDPMIPRQDERYRRIYDLADRGWPPVRIAQELGRTAGEVELILNLRNATAAPGQDRSGEPRREGPQTPEGAPG